ncbi:MULTISPECIES: BCCT family transporter [unclassified Streptomyces]|uniref:BCCT family transporter n=1 Tax=Streptomyces TaxID=1883 RepID=UPI0001C18BD0|nr:MULTISPECIES: BCCT family transporter [unclassified Streptomyces]MYR65678.1 BCCT family transporter [Streptomyces sp. SID4939]MYS04519.1 BCCT family transporter [Streptomyces sp. SID4940]MYT67577.1 BCCT family transporter [Streptomyces sp. SID8357]MYT86421.1 BCCT family transporter [Streptomyces sp. SID8360]MYU35500.1 BCCT family transporter [Streptomyces sp. SID8358]MYW41138.1 BCCT family transporter [Streptomyces sp. SID1]
MSHDEQRTGDRGDHLPVTADLPAEPSHGRRPTTDRVVFGVTAVLTVAFVIWGSTATKSLEDVSNTLLNGLIHNGGWGFMLAASGFVVFALWLAISRYGKISLGQEGEEPEFRTVSWVAMMFSAGMGIGLMFYGVSEPLAHFRNPPPGTRPTESAEAMQTAMATTLFHWTLHPWAIYAVVGLAIAYSTYRRRRRQTISAVFEPLIGSRHAHGGVGRVIDILAIFATLFGSAASLGLGALQIGSGFQELDWMEKTGTGLLVAIIAVLTAAFVASAVSGVERGIQWLSNINMVLALILAVFVFVVGPTIIVLDLLPTSIAAYFGNLAQLAGRTEATGEGQVADWLASWTVFYWAWWISWTPFVGMFIARISRGRTIRQFVGGVILVPSTVSLIWFAVFGGSSIRLDQAGRLSGVGDTQEAQLFGVLQQFPAATLMSILVMVLVGIFFVSGADAASIVMGTLSQKGVLEPARWVVIFWGVVTGAVAAVMLLIGNGQDDALAGLQNLTILVAAPFTVVMIGMCVSLMRDLRHDPLIVRREFGVEAVESAVIQGHAKYDGDFEIRIGPGATEVTSDERHRPGPSA